MNEAEISAAKKRLHDDWNAQTKRDALRKEMWEKRESAWHRANMEYEEEMRLIDEKYNREVAAI
jgi:hypothetical protein